jgi:hypothetical protein
MQDHNKLYRELLDGSGVKKGDSGWTNGIILCIATNQGFVGGNDGRIFW